MKHFLFISLLMIAICSQAQQISFNTKNISVYDSWEESPVRTGELGTHVGIIEEKDTKLRDANGRLVTTNILALQRSRYGSNLFGVRIDLPTPLRLTKTERYLHLKVLKPVKSRMMVIGLGRRTEKEWAWQDGEAEQFWSLTPQDIDATEWTEVVFPFKGFSNPQGDGIDILSLVIIPDVQSGTVHPEDFACFFKDIYISDSKDE